VKRLSPSSAPIYLVHFMAVGLACILLSSLTQAQSTPANTPRSPGYQKLSQALQVLHAVEQAGGWPRVPVGPTLSPGDSDPRIPAIRNYLWATGDLVDRSMGNSSLYDPITAQAARQFQERHGLDPDGVLGPITISQMNAPVQARIQQVRANLQRWRTFPATLAQRAIVVNSAEFRLRMYEGGRLVDIMKVIVGQEYNDKTTPMFSGVMNHVIFNPFWNCPPRLAAEKIAIQRENPNFFNEYGFEIATSYGAAESLPITGENIQKVLNRQLVLRQRPGPTNALGNIKFMFPNKYAVYLHDTPDGQLFDSSERAYSSGCIRVERPADLAEWVLTGTAGWSRDRIESTLGSSSREQRVNLANPVTVYITYFTAFVDDQGFLNFRRDIYGKDRPGA
jgi:murein L,D-transpeptidase YcbB/YkuD